LIDAALGEVGLEPEVHPAIPILLAGREPDHAGLKVIFIACEPGHAIGRKAEDRTRASVNRCQQTDDDANYPHSHRAGVSCVQGSALKYARRPYRSLQLAPL